MAPKHVGIYLFQHVIVDTRFCIHDLIKEDDWSDHPCTKKKKVILASHASFYSCITCIILFLNHMHHFVLESHASICSYIVCINSFIAYHKNDLKILTVATVFSVSKLDHLIERYYMIKFARSACIVSR